MNAADITPKEAASILDRYSKKKKVEEAVLQDETGKQILQALEDNVAYFIESIQQRVERYEGLLLQVIRIRYPKHAVGDADTPLLRRTVVVSGGELIQTPEEVIIAAMPQMTIKLSRNKFAGQDEDENDEEEEEDDNIYEDSDASSALEVASDCEEPDVELTSNSALVSMFGAVKKECYELFVTLQGIHDWIELNMQLVRDKERELNVMETTMDHVDSTQDHLSKIYDLLSSYLSNRAEIEASCNRYPHMISYKQKLLSTDDYHWNEVERAWRHIIRGTLFVYSLLAKNLDSLGIAHSAGAPTTASFYQ